MIVDAIINFCFSAADKVLSLIPFFTWDFSINPDSLVLNCIRGVFYLLPMPTVILIVGLIVAIGCFRIFVSLAKLVLSLLPIPFVG